MTTEVPITAAPEAIEDRDARVYAELQQTTVEERAVLRAVRDLEARLAAVLSGAVELDQLDQHVALSDRLEEQRCAAQARLSSIRRRKELLLNAMATGPRQRGRGRILDRLAVDLEALETEEGDLASQRGELEAALRELELRAQAIADAKRPIIHERVKRELSAARVIRVSLESANPFEPPAETIVQGTAWREFVEASRAAGLTGAVTVTINELTGEVAGVSGGQSSR